MNSFPAIFASDQTVPTIEAGLDSGVSQEATGLSFGSVLESLESPSAKNLELPIAESVESESSDSAVAPPAIAATELEAIDAGLSSALFVAHNQVDAVAGTIQPDEFTSSFASASVDAATESNTETANELLYEDVKNVESVEAANNVLPTIAPIEPSKLETDFSFDANASVENVLEGLGEIEAPDQPQTDLIELPTEAPSQSTEDVLKPLPNATSLPTPVANASAIERKSSEQQGTSIDATTESLITNNDVIEDLNLNSATDNERQQDSSNPENESQQLDSSQTAQNRADAESVFASGPLAQPTVDNENSTATIAPADPVVTIENTPGNDSPVVALPVNEQPVALAGLESDSSMNTSPASIRAASQVVSSQVEQTFRTELASFENDPIQRISLKLHPAELGQLQITIEQTSEQLVAQITATEFHSTEMLLQEKDFLLETLSDLGFGETSLDISYGGSDQDQTSGEEDNKNTSKYESSTAADAANSVVHVQTNGVNFVA